MLPVERTVGLEAVKSQRDPSSESDFKEVPSSHDGNYLRSVVPSVTTWDDSLESKYCTM